MLIPRGVDEWRKLKVSLIRKTSIGLDFRGHAIIDVLIHLGRHSKPIYIFRQGIHLKLNGSNEV